jgi:bacterioferritin
MPWQLSNTANGLRRKEGVMKAKDQRVIELLNAVLTGELTAINQYFVHGEMCDNWGYMRLHEVIRKQSIDEMRHAEQLIERVLFLEGVPNVQRLGKIHIGERVPEQLKIDLALEMEAIPRLNDGIQLCTEVGDNNTRHLLEEILESEEEHVDWLEAQLELIEQVGEQNYLAQQIKEDEDG